MMSSLVIWLLGLCICESVAQSNWTVPAGISYNANFDSYERTSSNVVDELVISSESFSNPRLNGSSTIGFVVTARGFHQVTAGLSSSTPLSTATAQYVVQLTSVGQIVAFENGVSRGVIGNYQPQTRVAVVVSRDGPVQFLIADNTGQLRVALTSTSNPNFPLYGILSIFTSGGEIGVPTELNTSDWCTLSSCPVRQCFNEASCERGVCLYAASQDGIECNDGDANTVLDVCQAGVCSGQDPCELVDCGEALECRGSPRCILGVCYPGLVLDDGLACDDGNPLTVRDTCESGFCEGLLITDPPTALPTVEPTSGAPSQNPTRSPSSSFPTNQPTQLPSTLRPTSEPTTLAPTSQPTNLCSGVVCSPAPLCYTPTECRQGRCVLGVPLEDGTQCDDGNNGTISDQCTLGICSGTRICDQVSCESTSTCTVGECFGAGQCRQLPVTDGIPCDDGNPTTVSDTCLGGQCIGVDLCRGITCEPLSQCHSAGTCIRGVCSNPITIGGPCDDRNISSINDTCTAEAECIGVDPCHGVVCPEENCFEAGTCVGGSCIQGPQKNASTECDDGILRTTFDRCDARGVCAGIDLCVEYNVTCEIEQCRVRGLCFHGRCIQGDPLPHMFPCDDEDPSTDNDGCVNAVCQGTPNLCYNVECQDESQCSTASCDPTTGSCVSTNRPNGTFCDDGDIRTTSDACQDGLCQGVDLCDNVTCPQPPACQAFEPSFQNGCFRGVCLNVQIDDGSSCSDGNISTLNDQCVGGLCLGFDPCVGVVCEQPINTCLTRSTCIAGFCTTPVSLEDDTPCDDGSNRTEDDICVNGECSGIDRCLSVDCGTSTECDIRTCFRGNCSQIIARDDTPCDDNNPNTVLDRCQSGTCAGTDLCEGVECLASGPCFVPGICVLGQCTNETFVAIGTSCDDGNNRTDFDVCVRGLCAGRDLCDGIECPTNDQCNTYAPCFRGECNHTIHVGDVCDDGNNRTDNDVCQSDGSCNGEDLCITNNVICPDTLQCYVGGGCFRGECQTPVHAENGTPCDDENSDTDFDTCNNGRCDGINLCAGITCVPQSTQCFDSGVCSMGSCSNGSNILDGSLCNDGNASTDLDTCQGGVCTGVDTCAALGGCDSIIPEPCHFVECQNASCVQVPRPNEYLCDDGNNSTVQDQCTNGICSGIDLCENVTCAPSGQCFGEGTCFLGRCTPNPLSNGTLCDDGNVTTIDDVCLSGSCNGFDPCADVTCAMETLCQHEGICANGTCLSPVNKQDGLQCNDTASNTYADACVSGTCIGRLPCLGTCVAFSIENEVTENTDFGLTRTTPGSDWNAFAVGAVSYEYNSGVFNGFRFSPAQSTSTLVVGLGSGETLGTGIAGYQATMYSLFFSFRGTVLLYEAAQFVEQIGTYSAGHEIEIYINIEGKVVYRSISGGWIHISSQPVVTEALQAQVSIFDSGASINDFNHLNRQDNLCEGVTCEQLSQCHEIPICVFGQCSIPTLLSNGSTCDDGNTTTDLDFCNENGECAGVDLCIGVQCPDFDYCERPPQCAHGQCEVCNNVCSNVTCAPATDCRAAERCVRGQCYLGDPVVEGEPCNDGDDSTDQDTCDGTGSCSGIDFCEGVICDNEQIECKGSSVCAHGICSRENLPDGEGCDDGILETFSDICVNGTCAGVNLCEIGNVVCDPPNQCQEPTTCLHGACLPYVNLADGTRCDDRNSSTDRDTCTNGSCAGIDLCIALNVTCEPTDCAIRRMCQNGRCVNLQNALEDSACDDGDNGTVYDQCHNGECEGLDLCVGIICPSTGTQCRAEGYCFQGSCLNGSNLADDITCDDGNPDTVNDRCTDGVCTGTDLCASIVCPPPGLDPCLYSDSCVLGQCNISRIPIGGACNDGNDNTDFDACNAMGQCIGRNLCIENNVTCTLPDQCHLPVTCANGACQDHPQKQDGTPCDDGDRNTIGDECISGLCVGVNPCDSIECPTNDQCRQPRVCQVIAETAVCSNDPVSDGTACDDNDSNTVNDTCTVGNCRGTPFVCDASNVLAEFSPLPANCTPIDISVASWAPADQVTESACTCYTSFGIAFSDTSGIAESSHCAQMICSRGFSFQRCDFYGTTVSQGIWGIDGSDVVRIPYSFQDTICGNSFTGTSPVPTSTSAPGATALSQCEPQVHIVNWGLTSQNLLLDIHTGDTVVWLWSGQVPLNVISIDPQVLDSGTPSFTGSFNFTFTSTGQYRFRAQVLQLVGEIVVTDPDLSLASEVVHVTSLADLVSMEPHLLINIDVTGNQIEPVHSTVVVNTAVEWEIPIGYYVESDDCVSIASRPTGSLFSSRNANLTRFVLVFQEINQYGYQVRHSATHQIVVYGTISVGTPSPSAAPTQLVAFNLLANSIPSNTTIEKEAHNIPYYVLQGDSYLSVQNVPLSLPFATAMVVELVPGTNGYLFALSDSDGSRLISLYYSSQRRRLTMYYKISDSNIQRWVNFGVFIDSGESVYLSLLIDGVDATVLVDSISQSFNESATLNAPPALCNLGSDCHFLIGARPSSGGQIAYGIQGTIYSAVVFPDGIISRSDVVVPTVTPLPDPGPVDILELVTSEDLSTSTSVSLLGDGSLQFDGTGSIALSTFPQSPRYRWSLLVWLKQEAGTNGYVFAKTDSSGSQRYLGLYSSSARGLILYYSSGGRTRSVKFDVNISDGITHRLYLAVDGVSATLVVDRLNVDRKTIIQPMEDNCSAPSSDCFFNLGQRMSPGGGAYQFTGEIYNIVFDAADWFLPLSIDDPRTLNMLEAAGGSPAVFDGLFGYRINSFRAVNPLNFSLLFDFTAIPNTAGYLAAKTNADGSVRHFAIYGSNQSLTFYFQDSTTLGSYSSVRFQVNVFDGVDHEITLHISGTSAVLHVDDDTPLVQALPGHVIDCPMPSTACVLYVGQRAEDYPFNGTIRRAEIMYDGPNLW